MHTDTHIQVYVIRKLKGKIRIRQERLSPVPKQQVSDNWAPAEAAAACPLHVFSQWFKVRNSSLFITGSHNRNLTLMTKITALLPSVQLATGWHD